MANIFLMITKLSNTCQQIFYSNQNILSLFIFCFVHIWRVTFISWWFRIKKKRLMLWQIQLSNLKYDFFLLLYPSCFLLLYLTDVTQLSNLTVTRHILTNVNIENNRDFDLTVESTSAVFSHVYSIYCILIVFNHISSNY